MTSDDMEPLYLLPDRFAAAEFSPVEAEIVLGVNADRELSRDNFNWIGAYLVEQVGLFESEVAEWFKSSARGLGYEKPLDIWSTLDGFQEVFDYAKTYKEDVEVALVEEAIDIDDPLVRSHSIANSALDIILKGFRIAGVDLQPNNHLGDMESRAVYNPAKSKAPIVRWKGNGEMEDYRIIFIDGNSTSMYYIVRYLPVGEPPLILQTGIVESKGGESQDSLSDSDINGRAPSAGEVAAFVIPLSNEVKNRALSLMIR